MRIALISDTHGNIVALDAVLSDLARYGVDRTVFLGDAATLGPAPVETVERLAALGITSVMGNHDDFMLDPALIHTYTDAKLLIDAVDWCRAELSTHHLDHLSTYQPTASIEVAPDVALTLFHGTPRSHMENLVAWTPPQEVTAMLEGHRAPLMAGGHTHVQMVRQHDGDLIINPGSVGLPFKAVTEGGAPPIIMAHAEYAVLEHTKAAGTSVTTRRVPLDKARLRASLAASSFPLRQIMMMFYA